MNVDLLIHNISSLATCSGQDGAKRGGEMADVGLIRDAAVAIDQGRILAVGDSDEVSSRYSARAHIDSRGKAVCPGFVDSHTHVVYAGDRAHEFEMRIQGATYMDIMAAGGGILSTMRHTRETPAAELLRQARRRLDEMWHLGTTTVEMKSGYGLDARTELKMLEVIEELDRSHPCDIVPTFLGAHTIPPEYQNDPQGYTDLVIEEMIPQVADWHEASLFPENGVPVFIDVFCEEHAFDLDQSRRILAAGLAAGFKAKIHVDQFNSFGGVTMAIEVGATSADHLDVTDPLEIELLAGSRTVAVSLPAVNFNLGLDRYADARALIDAGAALALATDINPGSAPCPSMPMVMAIAARYQKLQPAEVLNACTINGAYALELGHRVGSIAPGMQADLLILKEPDYRHLSYFFGGMPVEAVVKRGTLYYSGRMEPYET